MPMTRRPCDGEPEGSARNASHRSAGLSHPPRETYGRQATTGGAALASPAPRQERGTGMAPVVTMRQLLESGVHFGHQTRRWNPQMKGFILGERHGIYIIDLQQSLDFIATAYEFI